MPHQCTDCGRAFDDGSKEMLSGCPNCGGNTFQFRPDGAGEPAPDTATADSPAEPESAPEPPAPAVDGVARTVGSAATTVRELVGGDSGQEAPTVDAPSSSDPAVSGSDEDPASTDTPTPAAEPGDEDAAQASARTDVVSKDTLPPAPDRPLTTEESVARGRARAADGESAADAGDRPDLSELREELNEQFESIKVLEPGQYELNLMELYDREEYIIALQEDGKYTIQVPERWQD